MAQKMDKDETELKVPESLPICTPPPPIPSPPLQISASRSTESSDPKETAPRSGSAAEKVDNRGALKRPRDPVSRCSGTGCRKRVGLIGFRCRCGDVFCADHRYSDRHDCSYDYKAAGREAIARENPVVRAAKLLKV